MLRGHIAVITISVSAVCALLWISSTSVSSAEQDGVELIQRNQFYLDAGVRDPHTQSNFSVRHDEYEELLPYTKTYEDTDELVLGEQEIIQQGENGSLTGTYQVYLWDGEEYGREFVLGARTEPVNEKIKKGTRRVYETIDTPDGDLSFYQKARMWATSYDGNCVGCTGRTYTGKSVAHGICAVDPAVIALGSQVYVPGYGTCSAEDIGGAVQGNKIDLGFEDVQFGWWSSRYTDVYFLQ